MLSPTRLRLPIDLDARSLPGTLPRGLVPSLWRGGAASIEVACFRSGELCSVDNLSLVTFTLRALDRARYRQGFDSSPGPKVVKTISSADLSTALTAYQWEQGLGQHFAFALTAAETNQPPAPYWISFVATTATETIVLAAGEIAILPVGYSPSANPPVPGALYYTRTELDALFAALQVGSDAPAVKIDRTAAVAIGGHRAVTVDVSGEVIYADKDTASHAGNVIGISVGSASSASAVTVQSAGELVEPSWAWTPGGRVYLGSAGELTQTPPITGFVQSVGTAVAASALSIRLGDPIATG